MVCPKCNSNNVNVTTATEKERVGLFKVLFHLLLCFCLIGFILIIMDILKICRTKTVTYAVCQNCGHRWEIKS